jgi:putative transcriptional regulator
MNVLGKQIKERRHLLKIKQQELADLAGVSINTVVAVERGAGNPRMTSLAICNVLGLQLVAQLKDLNHETV